MKKLAAMAGVMTLVAITGCGGNGTDTSSTEGAGTDGTSANSTATAGDTGTGTDGTSANSTATAGDTGTGGDGSASIAAVIKGLDNPFFGVMRDGIVDQADQSGVEVEIQAAQSLDDLTGQADRLATLTGQDFGCYVVNPISETNLVQSLAPLAEREVPVVNIDLPIEQDALSQVGGEIATYIGTDNVAAGRLGGEYVSEQLGGSGSVALLGGIEGDPTSQARLDGFQEGLAEGIDVVTTVAADWDRQTALNEAQTILNSNPDLGAFFAANDVMALGITQALINAGRDGEVVVVGVDGIQDALDAVAAGTLTATVSQYPYVIGQLGVDACQAATAGRDLPESVDAPVQLVTSENAEAAIENFPEPPSAYDNPFEQ